MCNFYFIFYGIMRNEQDARGYTHIVEKRLVITS
jgi:hypothetical protein